MGRISRLRAGYLALLVALLVGSLAQGLDRVELKTGEVFYGKILRLHEKEVSLCLSSGGVLSFRSERIQRVRVDGDPERSEQWERLTGRREDPPAKERPPTQPLTTPSREPASIGDKVVVPASDASASADAKGSARTTKAAADGALEDRERGFAITPPRDYKAWPEAESAAVPLARRDPVTQASLTISTYPSPDPITTVKTATIRAYMEQFKVFWVERDETVEIEGAAGSEPAWLVETRSRLGDLSLYQVQVFLKRGQEVFIVTYSGGESFWAAQRADVTKSLKSFRFIDAKG